MIPQRKKTPEELAALREGLGIPQALPPVSNVPEPENLYTETPRHETDDPPEEPEWQAPIPRGEPKPVHSLRKQEIPLSSAPGASRQKTKLPTRRHDPRDMATIRKREALSALQNPGLNPAVRLIQQTASPFLYVPGYLFGVAAAVAAFMGTHPVTPASLMAASLLILLFIAIRKPRSRHHAALLFILDFLIIVFAALHYAPLFYHGS